jgi:hypothetical protein
MREVNNLLKEMSMSTKVPVEVQPAETQIPHVEESKASQRQRFSKRRLALAFTVAGLSDGLSFFLTFTPPLQWALDLVTAILLFAVLGRQWILLPGLVMEAIPGLYIFPFWVLVVGSVAMWGTVRKKLKK